MVDLTPRLIFVVVQLPEQLLGCNPIGAGLGEIWRTSARSCTRSESKAWPGELERVSAASLASLGHHRPPGVCDRQKRLQLSGRAVMKGVRCSDEPWPQARIVLRENEPAVAADRRTRAVRVPKLLALLILAACAASRSDDRSRGVGQPPDKGDGLCAPPSKTGFASKSSPPSRITKGLLVCVPVQKMPRSSHVSRKKDCPHESASVGLYFRSFGSNAAGLTFAQDSGRATLPRAHRACRLSASFSGT